METTMIKLRVEAHLVTVLALAWTCFAGGRIAMAEVITGKVLAPDGKPVAGAEVVLAEFLGERDFTVKTDAAGIYTIDTETYRSLGGNYAVLTAISPGYAPGGTIAVFGRSRTIRLRPVREVSGLVQDREGRPVGGATVALSSIYWDDEDVESSDAVYINNSLKARFSVKTGLDGRWTMDNIPTTGLGMFLLDSPQYARVVLNVALDSGKPPAPLLARPGASVTGRVVDAAGAPVAGINLFAGSEKRDPDTTWAYATSAADGTFKLEGLANGSYTVSAKDPRKLLVAAAHTGVVATEGGVAALPDMVATAGAVVQGIVTDAATGAPLPSTYIGGSGPHYPRKSWNVAPATLTDDAGRYTMRLMPGKNNVHVAGAAPGYLADEQAPDGHYDLELAAGETKTADFKLRKGGALTGVAVDEAHRPVPNAVLTLTYQNTGAGRWEAPRKVFADEKGNWSATGLQLGTWLLSVGKGWQVDTPPAIKVPETTEVRLRLKKRKMATVKGRVVDSAGRPVEGVRVQPRIKQPMDPGQDENQAEQPKFLPPLVSDAKGAFQIDEVRPGTRVAWLVDKVGYKYLSGGKVTEAAGTFNSTDIVLAPLTAGLKGVVRDAANKPVAGIRVYSPDSGNEETATTDAQGRFELNGLPAGEVTVIALHGNETALVRAKTGGSAALTLRPLPALAGGDVWRAKEVLSRAKLEALGQASAGQIDYDLAKILSAQAPDLALHLGTDYFGTLRDTIIAMVVGNFAKANPTRAALWAPDKLATIKETRQRFLATANLGAEVASFDAELGSTLFIQAQKLFQQISVADRESSLYLKPLLKLAMALKQPQADEYRKLLLAEGEKENRGFILGNLAAQLAEVDTDMARQILARIEPEERGEAYQQVVSRLVPRDMTGAVKLLEEWRKLGLERTEWRYARVVPKVVAELVKTDPDGAIALARTVTYEGGKEAALVLAVPLLPRDKALKVLREMSGTTSLYSQLSPAQVAALTYELDPEAGRKLFAEAALAGANTPREAINEWMDSAYTNLRIQWAFYGSRLNPDASRIVIEREFARKQDTLAQLGRLAPEGMDSPIYIALAMVALDFDRALQLIADMPFDKDDRFSVYGRTNVYRQLARYALAPVSKRATMAFDLRGRDEE